MLLRGFDAMSIIEFATSDVNLSLLIKTNRSHISLNIPFGGNLPCIRWHWSRSVSVPDLKCLSSRIPKI